MVLILVGVGGCASSSGAHPDVGPEDMASPTVDVAEDIVSDAGPDAGPDIDPVAACPVPAMTEIYPVGEPPDPFEPLPAASDCVDAPHDALILLGCPTEDSGEPSACQIARADIAADLMAQGYASAVIPTGGAVQNEWTEAETLATLLEERGVAAEAIFPEPQAEHTDENLYFASLIMEEHGWQTAWVVSDALFHLLYSAVCDSNCCVDLGRLTLVALAGYDVGHYVRYPWAEPVNEAECERIVPDETIMCFNLPNRKACAADFQL